MLVACGGAARAQPPAPATPAPAARADTVPADAVLDGATEGAARFNAPGTLRVRGPFSVPAASTVSGSVAVLGGAVTIAGRVTGRLTVLNGDVTFRPGARVDGDVLVVGGVVEGRREAAFGGELRIERRPVAYVTRGDTLAVDRAAAPLEEARARSLRLRLGGAPSPRTYAGLTLASGGAYNRAEGLPIVFGPTLEAQVARDARLTVDLLGVYRTAGEFAWDTRHRGHDARAELRLGRRRHVRVGGRLYDVVAPVEDWQLSAAETGLSAFLLRRDFRDWYNRHGGALAVGADLGPDAALTLGYADESWRSRPTLNPFTILRGNETWRPNPAVDEGRLHLLTAGVRIDTRNDVDRPWAGWYVSADYEYGTGDFTKFAPLSADLVPSAPANTPGLRSEVPGHRAYGRGFLDLRRYNRLTPDAQLNLRVVAGGWLHGDPLPAERRLSVSGPGALPGFSFREAVGRSGADVAQCSVHGLQPPGDPAECDRVALGQVEYRTDVRVGLFTGEDGERARRGLRTEFTWVVFADAGRGWLVGPRAEPLVYPADAVPALGTALADLGAGLDFGHPHGRGDVGAFGVYVAKSVSRPDRPPVFFLRLRRRF